MRNSYSYIYSLCETPILKGHIDHSTFLKPVPCKPHTTPHAGLLLHDFFTTFFAMEIVFFDFMDDANPQLSGLKCMN